MGEIVNLRRVRKGLVRAREALDAQGNRVRFGRTIAEKQRDHRAAMTREALLDGKLADPDAARDATATAVGREPGTQPGEDPDPDRPAVPAGSGRG